MTPVAVVSGAVANRPGNGGAPWERFSWAVGLRRLGFDVYFVEQIARSALVDGNGSAAGLQESANLAHFRRAAADFGLEGRAALVVGDLEQVEGVGRDELLSAAEGAALLVNISGNLTAASLVERFARKVYVDVDPGFTQLWHAHGENGVSLGGHDAYFTVGENIGTRGCSIPTGGIRWQPTRQPVVLEEWPALEPGRPDRFTTVASWRGPYGPVQLEGRLLGLKHHEWRKVVELPGLAPASFEAALDVHPADEGDAELLRRNGWRLVDPRVVAPDARSFRAYVQESSAEFSVAQGVYVETGSGWFSDRSVRYLASGRPVLVQDTGFGRNLPAGEGIVPFRTLEEAVAGVRRIVDGYPAQCAAARAIAEDFFDSDRVLGRFLDDAGVTP